VERENIATATVRLH